MHSTILSSAALLHDGDYDGCMYLSAADVDAPEIGGKGVHQNRIIVTRIVLEQALQAQRDKEIITITGPSSDKHDRHEVTSPVDHNVMLAGPWKELTLKAYRVDIERFVLYYRAVTIRDIAEQLDVPSIPMAQALPELDSIIAKLKSMQAPAVPTEAVEASPVSGVTAQELLEKADWLETAGTIVHGSAYAPMWQARKIFRNLARQVNVADSVEKGMFADLIAELRRFSETVAEPARGHMVDAANLLEKLST